MVGAVRAGRFGKHIRTSAITVASKKKRQARGKASRAKGARGEREAAKVLGGQRMARLGEPGPDVVDRDGDLWEVKRNAARNKFIYDAINQNYDVAPRVIFRDDNKEWLVAMPLWVYAKLKGWEE